MYIPLSGKGPVSQTNYQLQENLTINVTGPQKIWLWPSNPNVPKSSQYFRYYYNEYQNSICLDKIMLLTVTEQNLHTLKLDEALAVIWSNSFILQLRTLKLMEESNCYNMID